LASSAIPVTSDMSLTSVVATFGGFRVPSVLNGYAPIVGRIRRHTDYGA
jgi:hypothetical protein